MPTEIPALGPRPIVEPNDPPSDVVLTSSTPAPCTPTATKLRKDATPLRKSPTPHLRPDRKPPLTANAARELGRRNGSRWAALGSNGGADWARARSLATRSSAVAPRRRCKTHTQTRWRMTATP